LLFLPLILAHTSTDIPKLINCFIGFVSFSLCSSGFYIINDLLDIEADRKHPSKKRRPFAAGSLSIPTGLVVSMLCLGASTLLGIGYLPHLFVLLLLGYAVITLSYSYWLKEKMLLDVLVLAGLYSIRIIAGGVATDTEISPWLIAFSTFFFLSLALLKRFIEIVEMEKRASTNMKGRGYCVADGAILRSSGIASAFMSIVIFFLYITNSINATIYYPHPVRLWFITPLITYWFLRLWILAGRGIVEDDPVYFAMRDPVSWVVGLLMLGVVAISTF
jgi:4-hydroxybenzoate polyprenyltransferase